MVERLDFEFDGDIKKNAKKCLKLCLAAEKEIKDDEIRFRPRWGYDHIQGCEFIWGDRSNKGCYTHYLPVAKGNGADQHICWVFSKCTKGLLKSII